MGSQPDGIDVGGQGSGLTVTNYPRVITIKRVLPLTANGDQGYRSDVQSNETVMFTGIPCDIQWTGAGPSPLAKVPDDTVGRGMFVTIISITAISPGQILPGDIFVDDLGRRFKTNEPYFGAIDLNCYCERLRA